MVTQLIDAHLAVPGVDGADQIREIYQAQEVLFRAQPPGVQRMLELQARRVAKALDNHQAPLHFVLPDQVICEVGRENRSIMVPTDLREQKIGGLMDSLKYSDLHQFLVELEAASDQAVSTSAKLVRHAIAMYMVHSMLPAGRRVDVLVGEEGCISAYARRFFLPQWVALDEHDNLLVNSIDEAKANIASMQHYMLILSTAVAIAPYIVADEDYQRRHFGIFRQLVNQGRAMARYEMGEIIRTIRKRAASNSLNRGLKLGLPYFDDQSLAMRDYEFKVIPGGRIGFEPIYVVWAARYEQTKLVQDKRLSPSTRKHLLAELKMLEQAFADSDKS